MVWLLKAYEDICLRIGCNGQNVERQTVMERRCRPGAAMSLLRRKCVFDNDKTVQGQRGLRVSVVADELNPPF